jgi:hypothetical protein
MFFVTPLKKQILIMMRFPDLERPLSQVVLVWLCECSGESDLCRLRVCVDVCLLLCIWSLVVRMRLSA